MTVATPAFEILVDELRHLVTLPYTLDNLHAAAHELGIKRCWFHAHASYAHYDVPARRLCHVRELPRVRAVPARELLAAVKTNPALGPARLVRP